MEADCNKFNWRQAMWRQGKGQRLTLFFFIDRQ